MKLSRTLQYLAFLALAASQLALSSPTRAESKTITVFAAASLKNALDEVAARFVGATGNRVVISYAASSTLGKQVLAGAPADVFISADQAWMEHLEKNNAIEPASRKPLLSNALVVIAPQESTAQLTLSEGFDLKPLLGDGRLAVAETTSVPAGKYAKAALEHFGAWQSLEPRLAQAPDVRAALALVARGEAPLGIVYASDAAAEPAVRVVATFPAASHPEIVYPIALTREATAVEAAQFVAFAAGIDAANIFARHGFTSLTCDADCRKTN